MKKLIYLFLAGMITLGIYCESDNTNSIAGPNEPDYVASQRTTILNLTNQNRGNEGLPSLSIDSELNAVAQSHAKDMAIRDYFDHTNPDGDDPFDRMQDAGIEYQTAGENIAYNFSAEEVVVAWMNSSGHRANILNESFNKIGIGVYEKNEYSYYYVQVFIGTP